MVGRVMGPGVTSTVSAVGTHWRVHPSQARWQSGPTPPTPLTYPGGAGEGPRSPAQSRSRVFMVLLMKGLP